MKKNNKNKVKNPCKICLESVNNKTGLQCQGACKRWAHFSCLNYTPGKIQDIKTGILQVLCPCPDCKTTKPKEYLTDPPYTCTDESCSANQVPQCRSSDCPLNKQKPISNREISYDSNRQDSAYDKSNQPSAGSNQSVQSYIRLCPPPPRGSKKNGQSRSRSPPSSNPQTPPRDNKHAQLSSTPSSKEVVKCVCPKPKDKKAFAQKKSLSCSCISKDSEYKMKTYTTSSESHMSAKDHKVLYQALEDMCNTVGQLSFQLKELMCKMIQTIQSTK